MALEITLPFGKKQGVKDIVFTILTKEYPLRLIDLMNFIRKRYGKSVTFQAVRKAVLQLVEEGVLVQKDTKFLINRVWVLESKKTLDELHEELTKEKTTPRGVESIKGEVTVFTFDSLNEMMRFWQDLINNWFLNFKKGDYKYNYYQSAHAWEGLLHPDVEMNVMNQLIQFGGVSRGFLGVSVKDILELENGSGQIKPGSEIVGLQVGGPAEVAGLKIGDAIIKVDGIYVENSNQLRNEIALLQPGSLTKFTVLRNNRELDFDIKLGLRPENLE